MARPPGGDGRGSEFRYVVRMDSLVTNWTRRVLFILLHPQPQTSTQVKACRLAATHNKCGSIWLTHLFAHTRTPEVALERHIGVGNDEAIVGAAEACDVVVAAWGGGPRSRRLLPYDDGRPRCLQVVDMVTKVAHKTLHSIGPMPRGFPQQPERIKGQSCRRHDPFKFLPWVPPYRAS